MPASTTARQQHGFLTIPRTTEGVGALGFDPALVVLSAFFRVWPLDGDGQFDPLASQSCFLDRTQRQCRFGDDRRIYDRFPAWNIPWPQYLHAYPSTNPVMVAQA